MRIAFLSIALLASTIAVASAEEAPASQGLTLNVQPSGVEDRTEEARARDDRLYRRMQENEYLFRNICVGCGGSVNRLVGINAPFNPVDVLGRRGQTASVVP